MLFNSSKLKKFFAAFFIGALIFSIVSPLGDFAEATSISWSTATIASSFAASSTRMLYDSALSEFALSYLSPDGFTYKFASSTTGSSWSSVIFNSVLVSNGIQAADFFTTSSYSGGGQFYAIGMRTGTNKRVLVGDAIGSSYSLYDIALDQFMNGNVQHANDSNRTYLIAGSVNNGATNSIVFASSSPLTLNAFTTSSIASGLPYTPNVDFAYTPSKMAVVYTDLDSNLYMVTSSGYNPATWGTYNYATGFSFALHPRVRMDKNGKIWVAYQQANDGVCSTTCTVNLARYEPVTGWTSESIDATGAFGTVSTDAPTDLAFINGTTPVVVYYNKATGKLRYAYRDSGNSGCTGSAAANYTCGDIVTPGGVGTYSIANSSSGTKLAVAFYSYTDGALEAAYADLAASSASTQTQIISGMPAPVPITNPMIKINDGVATTTQRRVKVEISGSSNYPIQSMSLSQSASFYGEIWKQFHPVVYYDLKPEVGTQRVYMKLGNNTGAVSDIVFVDIYYDPNYGVVPFPPIVGQPAGATSTQAAPVTQAPVTKPSPMPITYPEDLGPEVAPFASEILMLPPAPKKLEPLCPQRSNAFSVGGPIIQDKKTRNLYVMLDSMHTLCPVPNTNVLTSWGSPRVRLVNKLPAYTVSSPLPYRPGTLLESRETGKRYFVNTKGRIHPFPDRTQFVKLGYNATQVVRVPFAQIMQYPAAVELSRIDIHPDGTLFVLNAARGQYAILQERQLHTISAAKLKKYGERLTRAVHLLPGEQYSYGDSWN